MGGVPAWTLDDEILVASFFSAEGLWVKHFEFLDLSFLTIKKEKLGLYSSSETLRFGSSSTLKIICIFGLASYGFP